MPKLKKIKKASKTDMKQIAEFIRSSAEWYRPFLDEKDLDEHYVDESWIEKNYRKREFYIGENEKGEEVGTISMQEFEDLTYLGYIYLDVNHVGNGYGAKLIDHAKKISEERNKNAMILIAHPEATWATKAYEKYGFERKHTNKKDILNYRDGVLKGYYEEGFHLYEYKLSA